MQEKLKDILSNLSRDIDQETLLLYLQDQLTPEKRHELEKQLADNPFASDAIDGLREFGDKKKLAYMVEMLNRDIKAKTAKRKKRREKLKLPDQSLLYISILILLLLVVICFLIIRKQAA